MDLVTHLTPALTEKLDKLYAHHERIDLAIESILEGQQGGGIKLWVDDTTNPTIAIIEHGSFIRFAGEPQDMTVAANIIKRLDKPFFVQPSPVHWLQLLEQVYGKSLKKTRRHKFSSTLLSKHHLAELLKNNPWQGSVQKLQQQHIEKLSNDEWGR